MEAAPGGFAEEEDDEQSIDQKDILYRVVLFLAAVTPRLFSRVLGADDAPFRPVMRKRGAACTTTGAAAGPATGAGSCSGAPPSAPSETPSRCARAARERAGASPRARSAASSAGSRTWIHWLALLWPMPNSRPWTTWTAAVFRYVSRKNRYCWSLCGVGVFWHGKR